MSFLRILLLLGIASFPSLLFAADDLAPISSDVQVSKPKAKIAPKKSHSPESQSMQQDELMALEDSPPDQSHNPEAFRFDLTDCVRMALQNNAEIKGADYDIEDSGYKLREAKPKGLPVFSYEYQGAPVPKDVSNAIHDFFTGDVTFVHRVKLGVGVPITTFGKLQLAQDLARGGIEAAKEKRNQKSSEVVLKVKQLYYGIVLARDLKFMMEDAVKKIEKEIGQRESQEASTDPVDLAKLKLTRYELVKKLGEATRKEEVAVEGLRLQIGLDRTFDFQLIDKTLKPVNFELKDLTYYLEESKRYRPESHLLDIALKAKEDEYRVEKRKLAPDMGLGGFFEIGRTMTPITGVGEQNDYTNPFNFTRAGVGVQIKGELNWIQATSRIKQKEAQYYKMSVTKDYAEQGLELDLRDTFLTVRQYKKDLEESDKAYRLARQLVFLTKTNLDVGVGDKKDYADALQAYLLMKGRYYESVFNYNVSVATLISKVGYQAQP